MSGERGRQVSHARSESKVILCRAVRQLEVTEGGVRVEAHLAGYVEGVPVRDILGHHPHETAGEIRRKLGRGALVYHHVIDQGRRKHIEREGTAVRLAGRGRGVVQPYIIITLRKPSNYDKTIVHDGDSRDAAKHLGGIAILCFTDLLGRNAVHDRKALAYGI